MKYYEDLRTLLLHGDVREMLRTLPAESVHCVVTSPPYFALRDYGIEGQIGLEPTPEAFVATMVEVFREVRRVLRKDGVCWLNLGDSYNGSGGAGGDYNAGGLKEGQPRFPGSNVASLKPKDLIGIPWRVAFALQADGWWLRSDIIWSKPNPMPESVTDRPTKSHEYLFLLAKSREYFYDCDAIKESALQPIGEAARTGQRSYGPEGVIGNHSGTLGSNQGAPTRNRRTVWEIATAPYPGAHFATFPPDLVKPCILAGTSEHGCCSACGAPWRRVVEKTSNPSGSKVDWREKGGWPTDKDGRAIGTGNPVQDPRPGAPTVTTLGWSPACRCEAAVVPCTVLDPFAGSGTTVQVARELGRIGWGIDLNAAYLDLAVERCRQGVLL